MTENVTISDDAKVKVIMLLRIAGDLYGESCLLKYFRDTCSLHEYFYFATQLDFLEINVALFIVP